MTTGLTEHPGTTNRFRACCDHTQRHNFIYILTINAYRHSATVIAQQTNGRRAAHWAFHADISCTKPLPLLDLGPRRFLGYCLLRSYHSKSGSQWSLNRKPQRQVNDIPGENVLTDCFCCPVSSSFTVKISAFFFSNICACSKSSSEPKGSSSSY
jgi:hypothetical protein